MKYILFFLLFVVNQSIAYVGEAYQQGIDIGAKYLEKVDSNVAHNLKLPDEFKAPDERKKQWKDNQNLGSDQLSARGAQLSVSDESAQQVIDSDVQREKFKNMPNSQLVKRGEKLSMHAKDILGDTGNKLTKNSEVYSKEHVVKFCEFSKEPEIFTCIKYLENPTVSVTPAKFDRYKLVYFTYPALRLYLKIPWEQRLPFPVDDLSGFPFKVGDIRFVPGDKCGGILYKGEEVLVQPKQVTITPGNWVSNCQELDERKNHGECNVIKTSCLDNAPRVINGETVSNPCWKEEYTYSCKYPCEQDCDELLAQGCKQIGSTCSLTVKNKCYRWKQKLLCPEGAPSEKQESPLGQDMFCMEGDCLKYKDAPNDEFANAMTMLSIFKEIQKDLKNSLNLLFNGTSEACCNHLLSFKNCCDISGWGLQFKLTDCDEDAKILAEKRSQKLCHEVGEYCAEKFLGTCIRNKTTFCCFTSKLLRLIHEGGRAQIGLGWGEADSPNCRGLTPEELAKLDFSKIDFSEVFDEIKSRYNPERLSAMKNNISNKFSNMQNNTDKQNNIMQEDGAKKKWALNLF